MGRRALNEAEATHPRGDHPEAARCGRPTGQWRDRRRCEQDAGVSENTFHRWRAQYGGLKAGQAKRLKALEKENVRLKKIVAEQAVDLSILREVAKGNF
jgi:hypothetical protein